MYNNMNHPSQLVQGYFTPDAFSIVQQVHNNLQLLRHLSDKLPMFQSLGTSYLSFENLSKYIGDLTNISLHLNTLIKLNNEVPLLKDIAPRVSEFNEYLVGIKNKLTAQDMKFDEVLQLMETNTKHLEDLFCQYEHSLKCLIDEVKRELCEVVSTKKEELTKLVTQTEKLHNDLVTAMPFVNRAVKDYKETKAIIEHLKASDLVTLALFTTTDEDLEKALKQIKQSEKYSNNESINRQRLNYKLEINTVLNALKPRPTKSVKGQDNEDD